MHLSPVFGVLASVWVVSSTFASVANDTKLQLESEHGARIEFVGDSTGWRWDRLTTPSMADGRIVAEEGAIVSAGDRSDTLAINWELVANEPGRLVFQQVAPNSGLGVRRVFSFGPAWNVLRIETWLRSLDEPKLLTRVGLLSLSVDEQAFRTMGPSPASFPVFGQALFAGIEDIMGESRTEGATFRLWQTPDLSVAEDWQFVAAVVVGWHVSRPAPFLPGESRTREAFLQYLDTIRVVPPDINLHSDTWWTLPLPFSETDVLRDIAALKAGLYDRTGLFFDTYALDLGWSDPRTLWRIDARNFPRGLGLINQRLAELGAKMGMWVSPSSGYAPGLDNKWLEEQGYEMTPVGEDEKVACFALGGRYQREFTEQILEHAREYSLGHVIFDGLLHGCNEAGHLHATGVGATYSIHAGMRDVMDRLRSLNPKIILEPLSCGHPPSPWWNMHTPFLLAPAGDDVPFGRVPAPDWTEALTSARDIAYRAGQEQWLVRTQALETFDIIVQSPGTFENMAVMAAGRGRWFMSANIKPELMAPTDWDFLAALVRWQRANKAHLIDARMIGGDAAKREAYGYMFHHADRDLYCIRNPWMEERTIRLPALLTEARDLRAIYPRRARMARIDPGDDGVDIVLGPYETMFLETVPAENSPLPEGVSTPDVFLEDGATETIDSWVEDEVSGYDYSWSGTIEISDGAAAELYILTEGSAGVDGTMGRLRIDGRTVNPTRQSSAGQFGAAVEPSPDNWVWLLSSLSVGRHTIDIRLNVPSKEASVGVFIKGTVPAPHDFETPPDTIAAFPLYQPEIRPWSRTLRPVTRLGSEVDEATPEGSMVIRTATHR